MRALIAGLCSALALSGCASMQQASLSPLDRLRNDLHLTADEEGAWRDYAAAINTTREMAGRRVATAQMLPQLATPRRLALLDSSMAQDLADFHRQSQATSALYGDLTPDQQRIFDRETLP